LNWRQAAWIDLQDQFGNLVRVKFQFKTEVRLGMAGLRDLAATGRATENTIMRDESYS
jgi:hypothetical protein